MLFRWWFNAIKYKTSFVLPLCLLPEAIFVKRFKPCCRENAINRQPHVFFWFDGWRNFFQYFLLTTINGHLMAWKQHWVWNLPKWRNFLSFNILLINRLLSWQYYRHLLKCNFTITSIKKKKLRRNVLLFYGVWRKLLRRFCKFIKNIDFVVHLWFQ